MKRRTVLRGLSASCALALAGCLADGPADPGAGGGTPTDTATPEPMPTEDSETPTDGSPDGSSDGPGTSGDGSGTPTDDDGTTGAETATADDDTQTDGEDPTGTVVPETALTDRSLDVTGTGCGSQVDDATVSFGDGGVAVEGTVWGNDLAYTARLASATYDSGVLAVTVASERPDDAGAAGQCITEIEYDARFSFDGGLPSRVVVRHRHGEETTTVATAER
ncbi:MAG: hypothetical protein ABEJ40_04105 [Haloarculaceae archaeon]